MHTNVCRPPDMLVLSIFFLFFKSSCFKVDRHTLGTSISDLCRREYDGRDIAFRVGPRWLSLCPLDWALLLETRLLAKDVYLLFDGPVDLDSEGRNAVAESPAQHLRYLIG